MAKHLGWHKCVDDDGYKSIEAGLIYYLVQSVIGADFVEVFRSEDDARRQMFRITTCYLNRFTPALEDTGMGGDLWTSL
jgi:hypothetical protein